MLERDLFPIQVKGTRVSRRDDHNAHRALRSSDYDASLDAYATHQGALHGHQRELPYSDRLACLDLFCLQRRTTIRFIIRRPAGDRANASIGHTIRMGKILIRPRAASSRAGSSKESSILTLVEPV